MNFMHSEDRRMLADTLGRHLDQHYTIDVRHRISGSPEGWSREQWLAMAELGIVGALFEERAGGFGGGGFDIAVVFEQLGKALVVEPFLGSLMAGQILTRTALRSDLVRQIIAGETIVALACEEPQSRYDLTSVTTIARQTEGVWRLSGTKRVIPQIEASNHAIVSARLASGSATGSAAGNKDSVGLFLIELGGSGTAVRGYKMVDGGRGGDLLLDAAAATLITDDALPLLETVHAAGIVALSWESIGVMDVIKKSTLDYLRTRRQFGIPIGRFQALQHRMVNVAIEIEQARSAAINAAAALDAPRAARERAISAAKFTVSRVGTLVAEEAIQLHGGIGMSWELPLAHYAKRALMIGHQLGDEDHHLARFMSLSPTG